MSLARIDAVTALVLLTLTALSPFLESLSAGSQNLSRRGVIPSGDDHLANNIRVELFGNYKNEAEMKTQVELLASHGVTSFNIINKDKKDASYMAKWIELVHSASEGRTRVCAYYSLRHNKPPTRIFPTDGQGDHFVGTVQSAYTGADEIRLISGTGGRSEGWNTMIILEALKAQRDGVCADIGIDYNPYYLDPQDQEIEKQRLADELETGSVTKIYLQFGTDLSKLKKGIEFCKKLIYSHNARHDKENKPNEVSLVGSVILPTRKVIAQLKSRSLKGFYLGSEFLNDSSATQAAKIVIEIVKLYQRHCIEILWDAPGIRSIDDIHVLSSIIRESSRAGKPTGARHNPNSSIVERDSKNDIKLLEAVKPEPNQSYKTCLLIFNSHDVRLQDNRALEEATRRYQRILPVFIWTREERDGQWGCPRNTAVSVCLEEALKSLEDSLASFGLPLVYCGSNEIASDCEEKDHGISNLMNIVYSVNATAVSWNKAFTPEGRSREGVWKRVLRENHIDFHEMQSSLLYDVDKLKLSVGFNKGHFGTLMPFLEHCQKEFGKPRRPTPYIETYRLLDAVSVPDEFDIERINSGRNICSLNLQDLNIVDTKGAERWDEKIRDSFPISESIAHDLMNDFIRNGMWSYEKDRSRADLSTATSQLSPYLRIGALSPNCLYWQIEDSGLPYPKSRTVARRLIWRDLAYYQLRCFPSMRTDCIRRHYEEMAWVDEKSEEASRFNAWKTGATGYPIVDAAMRELYDTGWLTQSLRMVVASFLVEYLRVNWVKGCEWFHYTLIDADSAINAMMWQNAGRSGIDQWNFVLSPKSASQDPTGSYTKRWIPELANLPTTSLVHRPWEGTPEVLLQAGVILGETYPMRIVTDLHMERMRGIEATLEMRRKAQDYNTDSGYDLIPLPDGRKAMLFTKKEFRIDREGRTLHQQTKIKGKKI